MRFSPIALSLFLVCFLSPEKGRLNAATLPGDSTHSAKRDSLVISVDFFSSAIYSGRNYGVEQVGLNPSLAYHHRSGLSFSVYSYGMGKTPGLITLTDIGVSWQLRLHPRLFISPGIDYLYNRFDANKELFLALDLGMGLDLKVLSLNNYVGFSFGGGMSCWYEEFTFSKYINLFYREKASMAIAPTFAGILGTKFSQTLIYDSQVDTTTAINSYKFMPLCAGIQVPVTVNFYGISLTVSPHYDIPLNVIKPLELSLPGNPFYITCRISYAIPLKKKGH